MNIQQNAPFSCFDSLYCEEEKWVEFEEEEEEEEEESEVTLNENSPDPKNTSFSPLFHVSEQDLFWEDEELESLFRKEKESCLKSDNNVETCPLPLARKESVEWILTVNAYYGFSATTAVLAVDYLDRFLWSSTLRTDNEPWMMQLAAVTCLSLAAKVEETHVPLLLDLQVECSKYVFDAETIQTMEILVLKSLKWRMNPVTPLSFLDHIVRRLGMKGYNYIHWEFLKSCENLLLSVISDSRIVHYLPSVLATATMLQVIHQLKPCNDSIEYENQLLLVLNTRKEQVDDCYHLISHILHSKSAKNSPQKRKFCQVSSIPNGSNDQWDTSSCISSSPDQPVLKKIRVQEQHMKLGSLSRVFVDAICSSPH